VARHGRALCRRRGREPAAARPGRPVRIGLGVPDRCDRPSTRTGLPRRVPVEREGRLRPHGKLATLAAPAVGEEDESVVVDGLQEDVADRQRASLVRGREVLRGSRERSPAWPRRWTICRLRLPSRCTTPLHSRHASRRVELARRLRAAALVAAQRLLERLDR